MENLKTKIIEKLKTVKIKDLIYPSLSIMLLVVSVTLFLISLNFISKHINKALTEEGSRDNLLSLNKGNFEPIRKKFNIKTEDTINQQITAPANIVETSSSNNSVSTISTEEKSSLEMSVLNGTNTGGLASELKKILEDSGFIVNNTGNTDASSYTVLRIKKSKENFKEVLTKAISEKYTIGNFEELSETDPYDVIIVIGK